ncbi:MAG: flagellar filament capping protein FliD [Ideonella sp.]|jgi:flagellar hook-associated protein 2|nr:flagellar filament capping protein FliD [Ideonella sp.]MBL0151009.1 flagellar filament capping protein FliD [Ideonella sp.]
MVTSVTNQGSLSSAGIGSGLDVNSIVTQLMAVESRPLNLLKTQAESINTKLSSFGKLQSYFAALRDKSADLSSAVIWSGTIGASADASSVKVATGSNAVAGNYSVQVTKLAASQTVTSSAQASSSATLNEGSLTIELGTWTGTPTSGFAAKAGASPVTISIGAGETSLASIRDKINGANAGVTASIVTDANGARLSLRSKDTGAENGFRITAAESSDDGDANTGLSALNYSATAASPMTRSQQAVNAEAQINGIDISSASNVLNNVVDGLTITLQKPTTTPVEVTVQPDTDSIKKKVTDFVSAFNDLANYLHTQTAYNADNKTAGALQGDQSAVALQNQLRAVLNQGSTASSTFTRLSDVGLALKADGTMSLDSSKLDNALGNLGELKKMFAASGSDNASTGYMQRWRQLGDAALGSEGAFASRTQGLKDFLTRNSKSQDAMSLRLSLTETRMRARYNALDTQMASLNATSTYLSQQITAMNKSTA